MDNKETRLDMRHFVAPALLVGLLSNGTLGCKKSDPDAAATSEPPIAVPAPTPAPTSTPAPTPKHHAAPHPSHAASAPGHASTAGPPGGPVLGDKIEIPQANVVFNAPGGWKKNMTSSGWALFKAPDNNARLGYVAFSHPGEATSRLGQLAEAFDLTNLVWGNPIDGVVGRDHFPDHEGDTRSCTLKNGDPCDMRYMTINPGGSTQIMVVYLVNTARGEHQRSHATASVASLRRM